MPYMSQRMIGAEDGVEKRLACAQTMHDHVRHACKAHISGRHAHAPSERMMMFSSAAHAFGSHLIHIRHFDHICTLVTHVAAATQCALVSRAAGTFAHCIMLAYVCGIHVYKTYMYIKHTCI